jgi:hypothetical protein
MNKMRAHKSSLRFNKDTITMSNQNKQAFYDAHRKQISASIKQEGDLALDQDEILQSLLSKYTGDKLVSNTVNRGKNVL